jgi:hypothetical protein
MSLRKDALQNRGVDLKKLLDDMLAGRVGKIQFTREALYGVLNLTNLPDSTVGSTSYAMWKDIEADGVTPTPAKGGGMAVVPFKDTIASGNITEDAFVETYSRYVGGRMTNPAVRSANGPSTGGSEKPANAGQAAAQAGAARVVRPPVSPNIVEAVEAVFKTVTDGDVPQNPQNAYVMFWDALPAEVKVGYTTTVIADTLKALFASDANKAAGIIATLPEDARAGLLNTIATQAADAMQDNLKSAVTTAYHLDSNQVNSYLSGWDQGVARIVEGRGADAGIDWTPSDEDVLYGLDVHVKAFLRTLARTLKSEIEAAEAARVAAGGPAAGLQPILWETAAEFFPEAVRPYVQKGWSKLPADEQHRQIDEARAEAEAAAKAADAEKAEAAAKAEADANKPTPPASGTRRGSGTAS